MELTPSTDTAHRKLINDYFDKIGKSEYIFKQARINSFGGVIWVVEQGHSMNIPS